MRKKLLLPLLLTTITLFTAVTVTTTSAFAAAAEEKGEQIIINPDNIRDLKAFGETDKQEYLEFYPPSYLFDNLVNSYSFWTQQGNSGIDLQLKEKLDKKVCSIELGAFQPTNTPFTIIVNDDDEIVLNGTLDNEKVSINFPNENCITDLEKLSIKFNPADRKVWTTLSEIKLFSEVIDEPIPPVDGGNVTKFIINNSKITMDLNDSEVIINTSGDSKAKIVEQKEQKENEKEESD